MYYDIGGNVKDSIATNRIQDSFDKKYSWLDKDVRIVLMDRHFYLLKRYGFIDGDPPDNSFITNKGQYFYDLLNCENLYDYIKNNIIYLGELPLSKVCDLLEKSL